MTKKTKEIEDSSQVNIIDNKLTEDNINDENSTDNTKSEKDSKKKVVKSKKTPSDSDESANIESEKLKTTKSSTDSPITETPATDISNVEKSEPLDSTFSEERILDFIKEIQEIGKEETPRKRRPRRRYINGDYNESVRPLALDINEGEKLSNMPTLPLIPEKLPVLPLKDLVVYNSMIIPLYESRPFAIDAIDESLGSHRFLFVCTQKDATIENPGIDDLYEVGSVVMVLRMIKANEGQRKLLVQGLSRARAHSLLETDSFLTAKIDLLVEEEVEVNEVDKEALIRAAREQSEQLLSIRGIPSQEIMQALFAIDEPGKLADIIATNMRLTINQGQALLECLNPYDRLRQVNNYLSKEIEVATVQSRIQSVAREGMDKAQKDYYLREQLKAIRTELGDNVDTEEELDDLKEAIAKAGLPQEVKKEADKQYKRLSTMHSDSAEAGVIRNYLEWITDLPWIKVTKDNLDILKAKEILDEDHFGLEKIKDRILEFLSVRKLKPDTKGSILCFAGPPGVGKTSLGKSIARAMGRKFQRISLGGIRDEAEIRGHRRTYIGAMPGRIIQALKQAGTRNPVILLDEIDKLSNDFRGDPSSALLEALDPEQNVNFSDHYLNVPYDLSRVLFICTANYLDAIPSALRDRLEIISLSGYTEQEKLAIAKAHLVPRQVEDNGLAKKDVTFRDTALEEIIHGYTREAGLRKLEREIGGVCRKLARKRAMGETKKYSVTPKLVAELLGAPRYLDDEKDTHLEPGIVQGLAWTSVGGEVLYVEATTMKGKGGLTLTGHLGTVMKESASAALSYARSHAEELGIEPDFNEKLDIHIHVPAGATPKDGPSAGVTMITSLISVLTGRSVRADVCMTGEITLRGRVMPVGGIKEKILAGVARGLKHAIIPAQNTKDLEEIPQELRDKIEFHPVSHVNEVLEFVLEKTKTTKKPRKTKIKQEEKVLLA